MNTMMGSRNYSMPRVAGESDDDSYSDYDDYYDYSDTRKANYGECVIKNLSTRPPTSPVRNDPPVPPVIVNRYSYENVRLACIRGDLEQLKEHLSKDFDGGIDDAIGESGENPLLLACIGGNLSVIKYLLEEKSANPNWAHPVSKVTGLMAIVQSQREEDVIVQCAIALIEAGADVNAQDENGRSALMIASKIGMSDLTNCLLQNGANPNLVGPYGHTALFFAAGTGNGRICKLLLEGGADILVIDGGGWMVADFAQHKRCPSVASALYAVQSIKWKPGMDSSLMEELGCATDEIIPESLLEAKGKLSALLSAVKGHRFLDILNQKGITFDHLLTFNDEKLREAGVDEIGTRMQINDIIKLVHTTEWQRSSVRRLEDNKKFTAAELHCMLYNISMHFERMKDTLTYIKLQIESDPIDMSTKRDKQRIEDARTRCLELEKAAALFSKRSMKFYRLLVRIYNRNTTLRVAGLIEPKKLSDIKEEKPSRRGWWYYCSIGFASIVLMKLGHSWSLSGVVWNKS